MAYFSAMGGSGAGGATITVSYDSSFYNKTITCSDGTTTYTKTTTSSGSTEFKVKDEGTWTITCNGVSRTVDVVLEYSTQMAITKTITVYGAASDTISFTDMTGAKTVTTNTSGQGSVSITFIPPSVSITFTSSVAQNPNNLSQYYSKSITIEPSTTNIYVMPDRTYYWYGYKVSNLNCVPAAYRNSGSSGSTGTPSITWNTRSMTISLSSSYAYGSTGFLAPDYSADCTNIKMIGYSNGSTRWLCTTNSYVQNYSLGSHVDISTSNAVTTNNYLSTTYKIPVIFAGGTTVLSALWCE